MIGHVHELGRRCIPEVARLHAQSCKGGIHLETSVDTIFTFLTGFRQSRGLVHLVSGSIVIDGYTVSQPHLMSAGYALIDTVRISLVTDALERHTRTVVHDDVTGIMILVKSLGLVADRQTAYQTYIHGTLVRAHLESVAIAIGSNGVLIQETILVSDAILHHDGLVILESAVFLEEHIPAVVRVQISHATIEVVTVAHRYLRSETVGIPLSLITVQVRVAVDDFIIAAQIFDLQTRITVLIEITLFYDVVMRLSRSVHHIRHRTSGRFVALYQQSVVARLRDINAIEMPVRPRQTDALIRIVRVSMIRHGGEVKDGPAAPGKERYRFRFRATGINVHARMILIGTRHHIDGIPGLQQVHRLLQGVEGSLFRTGGSLIVPLG